MKIYCYFGQQGRSAFNGGGAGGYHYWNQQTHTAGGGGGGTDCRLYPGDISNETSRNSRFVVAGGFYGGIASQNSDRSADAISRSGTSWGLGCDIPRRDGLRSL